MDRYRFWDEVITYENAKRFVAFTDLTPNEIEETKDIGYKSVVTRRIEMQRDFKMWFPFIPGDEYNLALSLCSDGCHRPVIDLDFDKKDLEFMPGEDRVRLFIVHQGSKLEVVVPGKCVVVPSTNHCHLYSDAKMSFDSYVNLLGEFPGDDVPKYRTNTMADGFGALRPPWVKKGDDRTPGTVDTGGRTGVSDFKGRGNEYITLYDGVLLPSRQRDWQGYSQEYPKQDWSDFKWKEPK